VLRAKRTIAAPPERVFGLLDDPVQMKRWMQGLEETTFTVRDPDNPVGSRFRQRLREGDKVAEFDGEILAYETPVHLAMRIGDEHFSVEVDYRLTAVEGGTRLDYAARPTHRTLKSRFLDAVLRPLTAGLVKRQMDSLKRVAEEERA
jgi:uncharacterized protein YndB with AHSA1/START domain